MNESRRFIGDGALLAIALGGLALRIAPLLRAGGPLAWVVDYDEGVYFSASAMLFRGVLPYRDFVFVHPPGILYLLGIAPSFAAMRIIATFIGAISTFLVGRITLRAAGLPAAIAAAALYATYPEAVTAERGPFLEMALNLACLAGAAAWLRGKPFLAGLALGAACAVKVFGGVWIVAALVSGPRRGRLLGGAVVAGVVLVAPLFFVAPHAFIEQTLLFHATRPPDGIVARAARLPEIFAGGHVVATILAAVGLLSVLRLPAARFFAVATILTAASFVVSASYWSQYNAHLAASECVLAGIGAAALLRFRGAIAVTLLLATPSLRQCILASRGRAPELPAVAAMIRELVPPNAPLFTFEPQWALAAGRLPMIADTYGTMLLDATRGGAKFPDTATAFQSPGPQTQVRARLAASRFAILGWRGKWQMNAESRAWFASQFVCDTPAAGDLCLWEKAGPQQRTAITFGDGWYAEEGLPPQTWRWMGARSTTTLPRIAGRAHLELAIEIPRENLPATITVELSGRPLDRFTTTKTEEVRAYDADGSDTRLVLTTNRTVSTPADARKLGLRLDRIVWRARRE
ncbi:MAG TPA: hypothetical protein VG323_00860 [Thermoanaerobaculia bacterium]|nr:hypothetical protein [Thermoanaerobaculia bacterium]